MRSLSRSSRRLCAIDADHEPLRLGDLAGCQFHGLTVPGGAIAAAWLSSAPCAAAAGTAGGWKLKQDGR
jgi:hypothetical protein